MNLFRKKKKTKHILYQLYTIPVQRYRCLVVNNGWMTRRRKQLYFCESQISHIQWVFWANEQVVKPPLHDRRAPYVIILYTLLRCCGFFFCLSIAQTAVCGLGQGYPIPFSQSYYYFIRFVRVIEQNPAVKNSVRLTHTVTCKHRFRHVYQFK